MRERGNEGKKERGNEGRREGGKEEGRRREGTLQTRTSGELIELTMEI